MNFVFSISSTPKMLFVVRWVGQQSWREIAIWKTSLSSVKERGWTHQQAGWRWVGKHLSGAFCNAKI